MQPPLSLHAWLRWDAVQRLLPPRPARILEIGAGLGSFGALLAKSYDYVGLEPDPRSYAVALDRVRGEGRMLDVTDDAYDDPTPFDVVCAFEVLEHLEHDSEAIGGWLRHLRPGGHILLSVPAGRDRFGAWDRRAGHYRRYDRADVVSTMTLAGLSAITTISYGFPLGRALELGRNAVAGVHASGRSMEERTASSGRQYQPPPWTASVTRVTSFPFRLLQRPFSNGSHGTGIVARGLLDDL